ncbi:glutathione synthase [Tribonema minus]|uniref:Glutathione synthetase n=1 Tax=Tribonema minus TaxID=303371 RepID=A0A835Z3P5_9STRA|nr:glutathione synthase [Tribonema minus]
MAPLDTETTADATAALTEYALGWSSVNGLGMGVKDPAGLWTTTHLPFCLMPNALPRREFEKARRLAPLYNELVDAISRDAEWLEGVLRDVVEGDPFTHELLKIFREVRAQAVPQQPLCLGIHRSDYMLHAPDNGEPPCFKQVELNTIASSFGCMSALTSRLHRHLIARFACDDDEPPPPGEMHALQVELAELVPESPALTALPDGIAAAHAAYGAAGALVVFVVQPRETNSVDQRVLELGLWELHGVKVRRMTLAEIAAEGRLDGRSGLRVGARSGDGDLVSVVYFRAGYTPADYPTDAEWQARRLVESSLAIKCPNIGYHLAGTKKVQQVLARPGEVERFLGSSDPSRTALLRESFAGLWAGDDDDAARAAAADPRGFVLKPQREGGGNNIYGAALAEKLRAAPRAELASYVLMQRLFPPRQRATLVGRGRRTSGETLSEWGAYSVYLGTGGGAAPLVNEYAGHLVRTKMDGVDEGGVATGYSFLSSPVLVDDDE